MTDTAKQQKYSKVMPIEVEHEAEDVWQSTGLTPRQLLERVRELEAALTEIATSRFCDYEMTKSDIYEGGYGIGVTDGHRYCANIAKAALAKHGGV